MTAEPKNRDRRKALGRKAGVLVLRGLIWAIPRLSVPSAMALGRRLGAIVKVFSKKRYGVAVKNLKIAFGREMSPMQRDAVASEAFEQFGMFAVESIRLGTMTSEECLERIQTDEATEKIISDVRARGKGCLVLTAHLGSFEAAARFLAARGYEVAAVAKPARDRETTELMTSMRARHGVQVIETGAALRPILAALRRNAFVAIVCDQNSPDLMVPFFGYPTGTVDGPAKIAVRTGVPIVLGFGIRKEGGRYLAVATHVIEPRTDAPDQAAEVLRIMTEVNAGFEAMIRKYPEQWLWFHDRWRLSPEALAAAETY